MLVSKLPTFKRPREKLKELGPQNLSSEELLAIILSTGTKKHNVISLSKVLLKKFPVEYLSRITMEQLTKVDGMGEVKAGKVLAAIELGMRSVGETRKISIKSVEDVVREVHDIRNQNKEHLVALYLNARNELLLKQTIAIGTLNQNIIEPRDVFADALRNPCAAVVLAHNHPSGDSAPSDQDILFTKKLQQAGDLLGIKVLDHIIVAEKESTSLKSMNLM